MLFAKKQSVMCERQRRALASERKKKKIGKVSSLSVSYGILFFLFRERGKKDHDKNAFFSPCVCLLLPKSGSAPFIFRTLDRPIKMCGMQHLDIASSLSLSL